MSNDRRIAVLERQLSQDPDNGVVRQMLANLKRHAEVTTGAEAVPSQTYDILEMSLSSLQKKVASYAKRATKDGYTPLRIVVNSRETRRHGNGLIAVVNITLIGNPPETNGWKYCARLDHKTPGTIINRTGYAHGRVSEEKLQAYRTRGPLCDHCSVRRKRNDTFVLHNDNDGRTVQVGRACLEQFLGGSPKAALYFFDGQQKLFAMLQDNAELRDGIQAEWVVTMRDFFIASVSARRGRRGRPQSGAVWDNARHIQIQRQRATEENREFSPDDTFGARADTLLTIAAQFYGSRIGDENVAEADHNMGVLARDGYVAPRNARLADDLVYACILRERDFAATQRAAENEVEILGRIVRDVTFSNMTDGNVTLPVSELIALMTGSAHLQLRRDIRAMLNGDVSTSAPADTAQATSDGYIAPLGRAIDVQATLRRTSVFGSRGRQRTAFEFLADGHLITVYIQGNRESRYTLNTEYRVRGTVDKNRYNRFANGRESVLRGATITS